ncbi:MAG: fused MFS/spermidine synthase [Acidobacteria bacterium]|nr:fused MFS/spermidine synthase [Acidobacteriota bacterium]
MFDRRWTIGALLFGSGGCAIVYQIGWLRELRLVFGASTAASAAVLAVFVGGLGAGGFLLGPRADRHGRPLLLYARLETIVALSAAATPLLLAMATTLYLATGGMAALGAGVGTAVRLLLSSLVLAVPTVVMGGTLPAAARAVTRDGDARRQDLAILYGLNALGAVAGGLMATFFLLETFGTRRTLWLAAAANLLVALAARRIDRLLPAADPALPALPASPAPPASPALPTPPAFVLIASASVGFAFFLLELVWYRMLGPLLGGSVFTFGLILAIALGGIGMGGLLYAMASSSDRPPTLRMFALTCLAEAVAVLLPYAAGDRIALLALVLLPLGATGFGAHTIAWALVTALVVLPPAVVAGYQFPLLLALFGRGRDRIGRQVGFAYAANTAGAIAGSLAGGFGLLPWLSAPGAWRAASLLLAGLGASAALLAGHRRPWRRLAAPALLGLAALALAGAEGPTAVWRESGIGAGRAAAAFDGPNRLRDWIGLRRRSVLTEGDGVESTVALGLEPSGYSFLVNGQSDGGARSDASTQVMLGLTGALLHPQARQALVIGLGTGSTAGWLAAIPSMERVDVVELEPLVADVARACRDVNLNALGNPKVHLQIGDAREALLTGRARYDLIASEPSNPFRAGIASLFTREYYQSANLRLAGNGLFLQWVPAGEVDARTLRIIYATMASVFPHVEAWQGAPDDLFLIGAKRPLVYSAGILAARIQQEPFRTALRQTWRADSVNGLLAHFLAGPEVARTMAQASIDINTDDRNLVEFGEGRAAGATDAAVVRELRDFAALLGAQRPAMPDAESVDWKIVDTAWVGFLASEPNPVEARVEEVPTERGRRTALVEFYRNRDLPSARAAWAALGDVPRDQNELAMAAALAADEGLDEAEATIDALRAHDAGEADTLLATLRARQARDGDAAAALESAFAAFRREPWALLRLKEQAVDMAVLVGSRSPALAQRLFDALREPFSLRASEHDRLMALVSLARAADFRGLCRDAVGAFEPHVPWNAPFLSIRRGCYEMTGDPRLALATRELNDYLSGEPLPLAAGLPTP